MNRRASVPDADALFRIDDRSTAEVPTRTRAHRSPAPEAAAASDARGGENDGAAASGRVRHDQKITVYLTEQELLDLEQSRLRLRAEFDIAVDRGRIVREAVAELLLELHERGPDSAIVRRLT